MSITLKSYAKINLALDVVGILDNGFHEIKTIYQEVSLFDRIKMDKKDNDTFNISLETNKSYLPNDMNNLAYRAAYIMGEKFNLKGDLDIYIEKKIPVSAGLAGGSGNAAQVILGINRLYKLGLKLDELMKIGEEIGSDIPFLIYSGYTGNSVALGVNRGEIIKPLKSKFFSHILLVKPSFGVSTKEVYRGMDDIKDYPKPDMDELMEVLKEGHKEDMFKNMINVLENYTLSHYEKVKEVKEIVKEFYGSEYVMMSGSGPTIIGFFKDYESSKDACLKMRDLGYEAYYVMTK